MRLAAVEGFRACFRVKGGGWCAAVNMAVKDLEVCVVLSL